MPIRVLLFDFDGLIIDSESSSRSGWRLVYEDHGHVLPDEKWALAVGTVDGWDPLAHLEELVGKSLDRDLLTERRREHELPLVEAEPLRPGVADYFVEARRYGLRRAIVSSASRAWVDSHLARLDQADGWDAIVTADHDPRRAKPRPDLYLEALDLLREPASAAIAFEDSPNGVAAARAAGIFCVAVPNPVTRGYSLADADLVLDSLVELPLGELLARLS